MRRKCDQTYANRTSPVLVAVGLISALLPLSVAAAAVPVERFIHEIQGSGASSPYLNADVIVHGVVVGDFQGNTFAGPQPGASSFRKRTPMRMAIPPRPRASLFSLPQPGRWRWGTWSR